MKEPGLDRLVRELTRAIASGDTEAFAQFYRERFDAMYAHARRCTGRDEAFCLDVVHDAMLKIIHQMKSFDEESALRAWLGTIVRRCAYDRLREESRRARRERRVARTEAASTVDGRKEHLEWLARRLSILNDEQNRLLSLRYRLGWTLQQIGSLLGLNPGAVDGRINRTLAALRENAAEDLHE